MKDYVAKRRLLKLADFLHALPRKFFDYGVYCTVKLNDGDPLQNAAECGTTACAIGWAPALPFAKREGVKFSVQQYSYDRNDDGNTAHDASFTINGVGSHAIAVAEKLFGLSEDEFNSLFIPGEKAVGCSGLPDTATPKALARHIRKFVAQRYG